MTEGDDDLLVRYEFKDLARVVAVVGAEFSPDSSFDLGFGFCEFCMFLLVDQYLVDFFGGCLDRDGLADCCCLQVSLLLRVLKGF